METDQICRTWLGTEVPTERYNDPGVQTPEILPDVVYGKMAEEWADLVHHLRSGSFNSSINPIRNADSIRFYLERECKFDAYLFDVWLLGVYDETVQRLCEDNNNKKYDILLEVLNCVLCRAKVFDPFVDVVISRKYYHFNGRHYSELTYRLVERLLESPYEELLEYKNISGCIIDMLVEKGMPVCDYIRDKKLRYCDVLCDIKCVTALHILNEYKHPPYRLQLTRYECKFLVVIVLDTAYEISGPKPDQIGIRQQIADKLKEIYDTAIEKIERL